jgi:Ca-activated chloride channel homolog
MHRAVRALLIAMASIAVLVVAAAYPVAARGEAWRSVAWQHPWWLVGLAVVPLVVWWMTLGADGRVPRLALPTLAPLVTGPRGWRTRLRDLPGILRGPALVLAIAALARPQNVLRGESSEEKGIDIVIALDLSNSMEAVMDAPSGAMAEAPGPDSKPGHRPTRLDTAKDVIVDFIGRRKSDRIGIVVFGVHAYVLSPPTLDYALLSQLVRQMELGVVDGEGTAIGDAVGTAVARLRRSTARSKTVILLTDGDSNQGLSPEYAAYLAKTQAVRIYTVQIGNGDEVDVFSGRDIFGQPTYKRMRYPVNPALLNKMAHDTGGEAFIATDRQGMQKSMNAILDSLEKSRFEAQIATMEDLFPFLLVPAVALLVLEALARLLLVRRFP